jgi:hypothetical protein
VARNVGTISTRGGTRKASGKYEGEERRVVTGKASDKCQASDGQVPVRRGWIGVRNGLAHDNATTKCLTQLTTGTIIVSNWLKHLIGKFNA